MDKAKQIDKFKPHYYIDYANLLLMQKANNTKCFRKFKRKYKYSRKFSKRRL
jgi:hypothetical protein